jgi:MFS transporter, OPA family, glycerol-3-phosphate transporter
MDSTAAGAPPTEEIKPHSWWFRLRRAQNWFLLGLTYAGYYLCRQNLSIVAPQFKEALHCDNQTYGMIKGSRDIAYGAGQFINGLLADRMGGKQALAFGAIGTIVMNLLFGLTAWSNFAWLFLALAILRGIDGYLQAFGAPGWVKINAAWFRREERGGFAGVFGGMIQLGVISVGQLWSFLAVGFSIPLFFFVLTVPKLDWRYMFIVPPGILAVLTLLMYLGTKNHPEDVGYPIRHDDDHHSKEHDAPAGHAEIFRTIVCNPIVWIVSTAYMCTGFVRSGIDTWWTIYLKETWYADQSSGMFKLLVVALPLSAFLGSLASGLLSDFLGKGRRAPIAAALYGFEVVMLVAALVVSVYVKDFAGLAMGVLIALNLTCNSTHSILGTAAAMDLGGRRMTGFALGVINSMQYVGSVQAAWGIGWMLDRFGERAPAAASALATAAPKTVFTPTLWFATMLPYALLATILMLYLTIRHAGRGTRGT